MHTVGCKKPKLACPWPLPTPRKSGRRHLPQTEKHASSQLHSHGSLCSFSGETRLVHLRLSKFNLSAVRTGSRGSSKAPHSSASTRQTSCVREEGGSTPLPHLSLLPARHVRCLQAADPLRCSSPAPCQAGPGPTASAVKGGSTWNQVHSWSPART